MDHTQPNSAHLDRLTTSSPPIQSSSIPKSSIPPIHRTPSIWNHVHHPIGFENSFLTNHHHPLPIPQAPKMSTPTPNQDDDDLFELWCCTDELCLPFTDQHGHVCNLSTCPSPNNILLPPSSSSSSSTNPTCYNQPTPSTSTSVPDLPPPQPLESLNLGFHASQSNLDACSLGSACPEDQLECDCCQAGCPPSPISLQPCLECNSTAEPQQFPLPTYLPTSSNITQPIPGCPTNHSNSSLNSPSLNSTFSTHDLEDLTNIPPASHSDALNEDIVWINKELEELIKCCCCDEPTPSQTLPSHHADAHPTHHVNFDMLNNPSITFPYQSNPNPPRPNSLHSTSIRPTDFNRHGDQPLSNFKCRWSDCNLEFSNTLQLTEHVNACHLFQASSTPLSQPRQDQCPNRQRLLPSDLTISSPTDHPLQPTRSSLNTLHDHFPGLFADCGLPVSTHPPTSSPYSHPPIIKPTPKSPIVVPTTFPLSSSSLLGDHHRHSPLFTFPGPTTHPAADGIDLSRTLDASIPGTVNRNSLSQNSTSLRDESKCNCPEDRSLLGVGMDSPPPPRHDGSLQSVQMGRGDDDELHVCRWESCTGHIFANTADLTEHISSKHVGSGKSCYICLWEGCYCKSGKSQSPDDAQGAAENATRSEDGRTDGRADVEPSAGSGGSDLANRLRKSFNQRQKVMRHLQTHTGDRPFECENCGKKFGEMATLVQHRRTHTNEKPYKCLVEGCGKSFALQSALTIHKRTHTGLKPFHCPIKGCLARFSESSNLSKHLKIHSKARKFECFKCGKKFTRSDQLARHLKSNTAHLKLDKQHDSTTTPTTTPPTSSKQQAESSQLSDPRGSLEPPPPQEKNHERHPIDNLYTSTPHTCSPPPSLQNQLKKRGPVCLLTRDDGHDDDDSSLALKSNGGKGDPKRSKK